MLYHHIADDLVVIVQLEVKEPDLAEFFPDAKNDLCPDESNSPGSP